MPFGCESYVDGSRNKRSNHRQPPSPMPFGCESYVDYIRCIIGSYRETTVTNAFRL